MKKILFISMELPYPDRSGGSKYAWQKIRQLSKENEVYLVSFNEKNEVIESQEYEKYLRDSYFFPRNKEWLKILLQIYKPYSITSRINKDMVKKIEEVIKEKNIDTIILDSIHMYESVKKVKNIPIYLTQQNIEYNLFETISKTSTSAIKKIIYFIESKKLKKLEKKLYCNNKFKGYIFISSDDIDIYNREIGKANSVCINPTIEVNNNIKKQEITENIIVFSGKMSYEPNVTAACWFSKEIFPVVKKEVPNAKFYIVGKDPTEEVKKLDDGDNIIVTGMVDDVQEYLLNAKIVVIPLLSGGGVKLKLYDALETNNIVITTSKGVEGTCFKNKIDLFVEDNALEFAKRCIENLKNPNREIANNGLRTLYENYDFNIMQQKLQKFIDEK